MSKHTPEPWLREGNTVYALNRDALGREANRTTIPVYTQSNFGAVDGEAEANADHIVACVNACAGINPEAVPDVVEFLRDIEPWLTHNANGMVDDGWSLAPEFAAAARAALAKLEDVG